MGRIFVASAGSQVLSRPLTSLGSPKPATMDLWFALKAAHDFCPPCTAGEALKDGSPAYMCAGCGQPISERFFLQAVDSTWHLSCLRCSLCKVSLESEPSCFSKNGLIYCREDYVRLFGSRACTRCGLKIENGDLVMRARDFVFHLACFTCASCHRPLNTGEYYGLRDGAVYCQEDFDLLTRSACGVSSASACAAAAAAAAVASIQAPAPSISCPPGIYPAHPANFVTSFYASGLAPAQKGRPKKKRGDQNDIHLLGAYVDSYDVYDRCPDDYCLNSPQRQKRMRTSFKHHQLRTMKAYFALNHNPDAKDLKQLADKTGLSKRVLQVWFQNARAKFRRSLMRQEQQKQLPESTSESSKTEKSPAGDQPDSPEAEHSGSSGKHSPPLSDVSSTPPLPIDSNSYATDSDITMDSNAASVSIGAAAATLYSDHT